MNEERIILNVDVRGEEDISKLSADFKRLDQELENVNFDELRRDVESVNKAIAKTSEVTEDSTRSMRSVRKEIKDLKDQLLNLEQGTEEYNRVLQEVANKTLELKDLNGAVAVSALDLGGKLENVVKVAGGIASAFSVAQAAQALFGDESEELQAVMVKLQAGIALVQGLGGLEGLTKSIPALISSFKDFTKQSDAAESSLKALGASQGAATISNNAMGAGAIANASKVKTETVSVVDNTKEILRNTKAKLANAESYAKALEAANKNVAEQLSLMDQINDLKREFDTSQGEGLKIQKKLVKERIKLQREQFGVEKDLTKARKEFHKEERMAFKIGKDNNITMAKASELTEANNTSTVKLSRTRAILNKVTAGTVPLTRSMSVATAGMTIAQNALTVATNIGSIAFAKMKVAIMALWSSLGPIALAFVAFEAVMWGVRKVMDLWNKDSKLAEENAKKLATAMETYNNALEETIEFEKELNKLRGDSDLRALEKQYASLSEELGDLNDRYLTGNNLSKEEKELLANKIQSVATYLNKVDDLIAKERLREQARKEGGDKVAREKAEADAIAEGNKAREEAIRLEKERRAEEERSKYLEPVENKPLEMQSSVGDPLVLATENRNELLARLDAQRTRLEEEEIEKRKASALEEARFKEELVYNTADFLGNLSGVFEEHTIASKGLETASVAISAAAGAAKCIASAGSTGPWGLAAGIAGAASITAAAASSIKRIWAVDAKNGEQDVSMESPNVDTIIKPTIKPVQNVLTNTELDLQSKGQRVYVVESDIQGIGRRVKATESASTF